MKIFSKTAFLSSGSGRQVKYALAGHLGILDGQPVQNAGDGYYQMEYKADGEDWELYPVMPEWCVENNQERFPSF